MDDARFAHACRLYMYVHSRIACNKPDALWCDAPILSHYSSSSHRSFVCTVQWIRSHFAWQHHRSIKTHAFSFASFSLLFSVILGAHQTFQFYLNAKPQYFFFNFNRLTSWMMNGFLFNVLVFFFVLSLKLYKNWKFSTCTPFTSTRFFSIICLFIVFNTKFITCS